jgi:hypothetical protein
MPLGSGRALRVERGIYIGECSWLAVLCSTKGNYLEAIRDLNLLYIMRGYLENLVKSWCRKYIQEQWDKRFNFRTNEREDESVLALKT